MLYDAKFVDKNRIINKIGHVNKTFFDKVYNKLFEELFESKHYEINILNKKIKNLEPKNNNINIE